MKVLLSLALVALTLAVVCQATTDLRLKRVGARSSDLKDIPDDKMTLPMDACPAEYNCCAAADGKLMTCPHRGGSCCVGDSSCCPANHDCIKDATGAPRCKKNSNVQFRELGLEPKPPPPAGQPKPKQSMSLASGGGVPPPAGQNAGQAAALSSKVKQEKKELKAEQQKVAMLKQEEKKEVKKIASQEAKAEEKLLAKKAGGSDRGNLKVKAKMSTKGDASDAKLNNGATVGGQGTQVSTSTMDIINHVIVDLHQSGPPEEEDDDSASSTSDSGSGSGSSSS